ncbi:hypothetical protein D3C76_811000 [compost metagenome]
MVGSQYHRIEGSQVIWRQGLTAKIKVMFAHLREDRHMGVAVGNHTTFSLDQFHDFYRGRFAHVIDIFLVGNAQDENSTTFQRPASLVQPIHQFTENVFWHCLVDLARQLDEAGIYTIFTRFPGQVEGVDWNAMAAKPRARIVGSKTKWLGGCGIDHFEDVDTHAISDNLHFIDQADVYGPMNIFQKLCHFSGLGGAYRNDFFNGLIIQSDPHLQAGWCMPADDLGNCARFEVGIAGIFPLG